MAKIISAREPGIANARDDGSRYYAGAMLKRGRGSDSSLGATADDVYSRLTHLSLMVLELLLLIVRI